MIQHLYTHAEWIAAGGWQPFGVTPGDKWLVIAGVNDDGSFAWASWDAPTVDPATRLNSSVPCIDQRAATKGQTIAPVAPAAPELTAEEKLAVAAAVLADVDQLTAPVTSVDVVEILLDLKTALGG